MALALQKGAETLTMHSMKQAVVQGKALLKAKEKLEEEYTVMITSVDENLKTLINWIERCYNRFAEKVEGRTEE